MKKILLIGAGRSTAYIFKYFIKKMESLDFELTVNDIKLETAKILANNHPRIYLNSNNIQDKPMRHQLIQSHDLIISMLPAHMHIAIAEDCIHYKKTLITASYVSDDMKNLHQKALENNVMLLNEMGVDPGIDHMSAMKLINDIKNNQGKMTSFESFTGGLVAPESDDNLWHYKFTWNPRNVVLAGQGGASKFIEEGKYKYIPYQKLFRRTEFIDLEGFGTFEGYANRDSLKYRSIYGLNDIKTMYRGTLRRVGFSKAWDLLVQLGMTDDTYKIENSKHMSYREFTNSFLAYHPTDSVELKLRHYLKIDQDDILWFKLLELDLFNPDKKIGLKNASPAQALEKILLEKWQLRPEDKDMIVMYHKFGFEKNNQNYQIDATMICLGENQHYTAMAKTVGLPIAIAAIKILFENLHEPGVVLPILPKIYLPVLKELESWGIVFKEKEVKKTDSAKNNFSYS